MKLQGKAALVTGGGVGAGRAIVLALAKAGCDVAVNYAKSADEAAATAREAEDAGVRSLAVRADVRDDSQVRAMFEETTTRFGRLDVLVNNAGVTRFIDHGNLEGVTDEAWSFIFDTNVRGTFYCARAATPALRADGGGVIINVSSIAGVYAMGSSIPYCASKAAINNLTVTLARALAPEIRVNAVAPGFIDTGWWSELENQDAIKQLAALAAPLKKVCMPEDVADAVLGLIGADLITGQIVVVDGGTGIAGGLPGARR
jgi:3-oxoacyl-[acyl-carrier protein] reductase